ncbi:cytidine deaminase [Streptomyces sp. 4N509B]|uniref:cytidine deaminase n=1 Tax=Streptomyces sp. 4N509B TaxID=3457413 RepID=UPI003FD05E3B
MTTLDDAIDPEDRKIITLARSARARRPGVPEGAAVRDETGRTYVATTVALDALRLSALQAAVAMAVASGAGSLEAAAVVSDSEDTVPAGDLAAVRELGGPSTPVLLAGPDGQLRATITGS